MVFDKGGKEGNIRLGMLLVVAAAAAAVAQEASQIEMNFIFLSFPMLSNLNLVNVKWLFDVGTIWQEPHERFSSV